MKIKSGFFEKFSLKTAQKITLSFIAVIVIGAFFLCLPMSNKSGSWQSFFDALFMATSCVSVTGLILHPIIDVYSMFGQLIILILVQIGGLGFMTISTFIIVLTNKKITLKNRIALSDALSAESTKGVIRLTKNIVILTLSIELLGALILLPLLCAKNGAIGIWQSIFLSVSAFCNAGFDIFNNGLFDYTFNITMQFTLCILVVLGGMGFTVVMDLAKNKFNYKKLRLHSKIVIFITISLIILGAILFLLLEYSNPLTIKDHSFFEKVFYSFVLSINCRSAGFGFTNYTLLRDGSKFISNIFMFIGASPGGTGGGIKTTTFALLLLALLSVIKNENSIVVFKHRLGHTNALKAISIFVMGIFIVSFFTFSLYLKEQNNLQAIHYIPHIVISTFSNVSFYSQLISAMSAYSKINLMLVMLIGRIGLINLSMIFFSKRGDDIIKYPQGNIIIS